MVTVSVHPWWRMKMNRALLEWPLPSNLRWLIPKSSASPYFIRYKSMCMQCTYFFCIYSNPKKKDKQIHVQHVIDHIFPGFSHFYFFSGCYKLLYKQVRCRIDGIDMALVAYHNRCWGQMFAPLIAGILHPTPRKLEVQDLVILPNQQFLKMALCSVLKTGVGNCPILGILDITWKSSH